MANFIPKEMFQMLVWNFRYPDDKTNLFHGQLLVTVCLMLLLHFYQTKSEIPTGVQRGTSTT